MYAANFLMFAEIVLRSKLYLKKQKYARRKKVFTLLVKKAYILCWCLSNPQGKPDEEKMKNVRVKFITILLRVLLNVVM